MNDVSSVELGILANFNRFALNDPKLRSYFPVYTSLYALIDCLRRFPAYTGFLAISTYLFK